MFQIIHQRKSVAKLLTATAIICSVLVAPEICHPQDAKEALTRRCRVKSVSSNALVATWQGVTLAVELTHDAKISVQKLGASEEVQVPGTLADAIVGSEIDVTGVLGKSPSYLIDKAHLYILSNRMVIFTANPGPVALAPLPEVRRDLEDKIVHGFGKYVSRDDANAFPGCSAPPGGAVLPSAIVRDCLRVGELSLLLIEYDSTHNGWAEKHHYLETARNLMVAAFRRACALNDATGCDNYAKALADAKDLAGARVIWQSSECWTDSCHANLQKAGLLAFNPPLDPLPMVPGEIANHFNSITQASLKDCLQMPTQLKPVETLGSACSLVAGRMRLDTVNEHEWAAKHGYLKEETSLAVAFSKRACSFGDGDGCFNYIYSVKDRDEVARLRSLPQCQASDLCRSNGAIQLAEVARREAARKADRVDLLNAVNESLGTVSDTLEQHNQQQAAQNDARMQQAQAQVAANDARRAEQTYTKTFSGETSNGAIRKETLVGNNTKGWTDTIQCFAPGASLPYDSFSRSGPTEFIQNIPACPAPPAQPTIATTPSPTVAPPVPYQKPPSTGGTVVASGSVCPASGYIFTSYGDAATGVPCKPGQPIASGTVSSSTPTAITTTAASGFQSVSPVFNCIAQSYVHDDLTFTNNCNVPLYVTWWIGGHSGSWTIDPGTSNGTGYTGADVAAGGGDTFYVCPKGASPVDGSGHVLTSAASNYTCKF